VAHAKIVAKALAAVPGSRVNPAAPQTHQFQYLLPYAADPLNETTLRQAEETGRALFGGWRATAVPGTSFTEITVAGPALEWTPQEIEDALGQFLKMLR
jgi:hypothetical protein